MGDEEASLETRIKDVLSEERSHYQYIDAVARLMTRANVDDLMAALPEPFASKFVQHGLEHWAPKNENKGERFVIGRPLPDEVFAAFREWYERQA